MSALLTLLPVKTVSEANAHTHWRARQKRAKGQRSSAKLLVLASLGRRKLTFPLAVTLTRISPRALDDDNLSGSQKHVRDGIADALGIDDRDARVLWLYAQRRGAPKEYAVEIRIDARATP